MFVRLRVVRGAGPGEAHEPCTHQSLNGRAECTHPAFTGCIALSKSPLPHPESDSGFVQIPIGDQMPTLSKHKKEVILCDKLAQI